MTKEFVMTWTPPSSGTLPFTDYRVEYAVSGQSVSTVHTGSGDPAYRLTGLTDYEIYQVRVGGINAAGSGDYSDLSYKYASQHPSAPLSLASGTPSASGDLNLTWLVPQFNGDTAISDYNVIYTPSGSSTTSTTVGGTDLFKNLDNLDASKVHHVVVNAINSAGSGVIASGDFTPYYSAAPPTTTTTTAAPGGGITPVVDNQVRFYVPASETGILVNATTSTGYFRLTDGTNNSTITGGGTYTGTQYHYMYSNASVSLTTLVAGDRTVRLFPCDAAGTLDASATIYGCSLISNTNKVTAVDISHCSGIKYVALMSEDSTQGRKQFGAAVNSLQPSGITEVRAVGIKLGSGPQSYYSHTKHTSNNGWYFGGGGIDLHSQNLEDAELDQFYTDLISDADPTLGTLIVTGNPGVSSDDPSIATGKGYTVEG